MKTITITTENLVLSDNYDRIVQSYNSAGIPTTYYYKFKDTYNYRFPQGAVTFQDFEIALVDAAVYNSWYAVSRLNGNYFYQYIFPENGGASTNNVYMDDGTYSVAQLNTFLQYVFIQNNHYLIDGSGNFVYFAEWIYNDTANGIQLIVYPLPTTMTGYTYPAGATWTIDGTGVGPQIVVPNWSATNVGVNNMFGKLVGYSGGTYPAAASTNIETWTNWTVDASIGLTGKVPIQWGLSYVIAIKVGVSLLYNNFAIPVNHLFTFPSTYRQYGTMINANAQAEFAWMPVTDGIYESFQVRLYDQSGQRLLINDSDIALTFIFRKRGPQAKQIEGRKQFVK